MNIPLKRKIQLWFEFLKLAHKSIDPVVIANLRKSNSFYEPWGDYLNTSFTRWWTTHRHLFRTVSKMRKMNSSDLVDESALYVVIPYTYAPTTAAKILQRMYEEELELRISSKKKVKKVYGGDFALTTDDFQVSQFAYYHRFAKEVYLPLNAIGGKVTTKMYVDLAKKSFAKQNLVTSWKEKELARRKVPFKDSSDLYANHSKRARDFVHIVTYILKNVSSGEFPGDYLTASVKNQGKIRKESPNYPIRKFKKGVAHSRYQDKIEREKPFNVYPSTSKKIY
jgi:hypothetical protein